MQMYKVHVEQWTFPIVESHFQNDYEDSNCNLQYFPVLSEEHIYLTPYSLMNVRLAAQVLSESVGNMLLQFGPPDAAETAHLSLLMDKFFDCCNVRNTQEYKTKKKPFLKPYSDINDTRLEWLQDVFLKYHSEWKTNIDNR